ncbi:protein of unknown function (plasmid) [Methylocella tundrae]|uniref:Uncharacterized protein n=1 Tax=Methylocella tundrae TaxID=227605 RepID=A0A4U8Z7X4_METTU|nr:protein of unknown function [Methylocella tundrae]
MSRSLTVRAGGSSFPFRSQGVRFGVSHWPGAPAASVNAPLHAVPAAGGAPPLRAGATGLDDRANAAEKEGNMKLPSLIELLQLSRVELCDQLAQLTDAHLDIPEGLDERALSHALTFA